MSHRINPWVASLARVAGSTVVSLACAAVVLGHAPRVRAADDVPVERRPTRGVEIPAGVVVGDADATALELNPGQLGALTDSSFVLVQNIWRSDAVRPGRGTGLFVASPFVGNTALGIGYQYVRPSGPDVIPDPIGKLDIGLAFRVTSRVGLGATWSRFWSGGAGIDGHSTWDIGLSLRPYRRLGLGLVVHDVGRPSVEGVGTLQRVWEPEISLRPFGTDRLEVGAAVRVGEQSHDRGSRGRVSARLFDGLRLFAQVETAPYGPEPVTDYRGTLGLWVDFDHLGVGVAGIGGSNGGFGPSEDRRIAAGGSFMLRLSGDRYTGFSGPRRIERVEIAGLGSDRAFVDMVVLLRRLAADDATDGVLVRIGDLDLGYGRIEELRDLIATLRTSGKTVTAYLSGTGTPEYYLAVACDRIIVAPTQGLWLTGMSQTVTFYKAAMERLGVAVDLVRIAEFKGAMEPFVMTEQSEPVRANKNALLDDSFARVVAAIAEGRKGAGISPERARTLIDKGVFMADEARGAGLVDEVKPWADMEKIDGVKVHRPDDAPLHPIGWARPRVVVVLVDGSITGGKSQELPFGFEGVAGSDTVIAALDAARRDSSTRAVVLRVNSRGGSAEASDDMALAVARVRKAGKPVIVSMGDVAASGGYYIAAPADAIFAEPSTITGSIGIFTFHLDLRALLDKIGLGIETHNRGAHADYFSPYKPWGEDERAMAADTIRRMYDRFLDTVVEGRRSKGLTRDGVDEIGRGHVWTGAQAMGIKLVDHKGGLAAAIDEAVRRGRVPRGSDGLPELTILPRPPGSPLGDMLGIPGLDTSSAARALGAASVSASDATVSTLDATAGAPAMAPVELALRLLGPAARDIARVLAPILAAGGRGNLAMSPYDLRIR